MTTNQLRPDLQVIADIIPEKVKVLELGCADGKLLSYLEKNKQVDGRGIEIDPENIAAAVQKGVSAIQGDIDQDLHTYPDNCFDYVISSQVIQATHRPKDVLKHMLRIGKQCVISIPNFGHWRNRIYLLSQGKMPVTKALQYQWYETPNIHFCTVKDFYEICDDLDCKIEYKLFLNEELRALSNVSQAYFANLLADKAIFLIKPC